MPDNGNLESSPFELPALFGCPLSFSPAGILGAPMAWSQCWNQTNHISPSLGCSWSCINEAKGGNGFVLMLTWLSTKMQVLLPLCFSIQHHGQEAAWEGEEERAEVIGEFYKGFYPAAFKTLIMPPAALHFLQHFPFVGSW